MGINSYAISELQNKNITLHWHMWLGYSVVSTFIPNCLVDYRGNFLHNVMVKLLSWSCLGYVWPIIGPKCISIQPYLYSTGGIRLAPTQICIHQIWQWLKRPVQIRLKVTGEKLKLYSKRFSLVALSLSVQQRDMWDIFCFKTPSLTFPPREPMSVTSVIVKGKMKRR